MVVCHRLQALSNLITLAWDKSSFSDSAERHQFSSRVLHHRMIADSSVLPQYSTSSASRSNSTSYDFFSGRAEPSEKMFPLTSKWDGNEDPFLRLYRANSHFIDPYVLTRLCLHRRREKKTIALLKIYSQTVPKSAQVVHRFYLLRPSDTCKLIYVLQGLICQRW